MRRLGKNRTISVGVLWSAKRTLSARRRRSSHVSIIHLFRLSSKSLPYSFNIVKDTTAGVSVAYGTDKLTLMSVLPLSFLRPSHWRPAFSASASKASTSTFSSLSFNNTNNSLGCRYCCVAAREHGQVLPTSIVSQSFRKNDKLMLWASQLRRMATAPTLPHTPASVPFYTMDGLRTVNGRIPEKVVDPRISTPEGFLKAIGRDLASQASVLGVSTMNDLLVLNGKSLKKSGVTVEKRR